jgi:hypothetical protein
MPRVVVVHYEKIRCKSISCQGSRLSVLLGSLTRRLGPKSVNLIVVPHNAWHNLHVETTAAQH